MQSPSKYLLINLLLIHFSIVSHIGILNCLKLETSFFSEILDIKHSFIIIDFTTILGVVQYLTLDTVTHFVLHDITSYNMI